MKLFLIVPMDCVGASKMSMKAVFECHLLLAERVKFLQIR